MSRAPHTVKTHFADEATLEHMAKLERENARLREALVMVRDWYSVDPLHRSPLDQWEVLADEFYRETGLLRPGKDAPAAANETEEQEAERTAIWKEWANNRIRIMREKVRAALEPES